MYKHLDEVRPDGLRKFATVVNRLKTGAPLTLVPISRPTIGRDRLRIDVAQETRHARSEERSPV